MKRTLKTKRYLIGLPVFVFVVVLGILLCKSTSAASSARLTPEQIYEIHKEYIESTYGPGTGFTIDSYGESGIGYVNYETGEASK